MTQTIVKWSLDGIFKADASLCFEEIKEIGEEVKPEQVLDKARDESTELHKCFDWDDSSAAEKYRLYQARSVINHIVVVSREVSDEKKPAKVRVMMKNENSPKAPYKQTLVMVKDDGEYQKLLAQAYRELHAFKVKYACLSELQEIFSLID